MAATSRRRWFIQRAVLSTAIAGGTSAAAVAIAWLPEQALRQGEQIDLTFWFATGIGIFIFLVVAATILFSVVKFRKTTRTGRDPRPYGA